MKIGPYDLVSPVVLAPMAGVTNAPFRELCRSYGGGLYVNEMVSARALCEGSRKTDEMVRFGPGESPRSLQLVGVDPHYVGQAVAMLVDGDRLDHLDLNFGCPVRKVTRGGGGAALPYKRRLFAAVVRAAVRAAQGIPVTIKMRVGVDDHHHTYLDAGRIAADEGVVAVTLHGRTAAQLYSGTAEWSHIGRLRQELPPDVAVLGNGDIWDAPDAVAMMAETGCDGVVIGRGCLGRPWLFARLDAALAGRSLPPPPNTADVAEVMARHARLLVDHGGDRGVREFRKHTAWYLKGYPVGGELRGRLGRVSTLDELDDLLAPLVGLAADLPEDNLRVKRGHTGGPQTVALPHGWLDDPEADAAADPDADSTASGG